MKISIDTKEDSHEDIRKVIKMLQQLVGDTQEIFTNESQAQEPTISPFANIFGDTSAQPTSTTSEINQEKPEETNESTEDLFAELFSEEELKKMNETEAKEEIKPKDKKYNIEFF